MATAAEAVDAGPGLVGGKLGQEAQRAEVHAHYRYVTAADQPSSPEQCPIAAAGDDEVGPFRELCRGAALGLDSEQFGGAGGQQRYMPGSADPAHKLGHQLRCERLVSVDHECDALAAADYGCSLHFFRNTYLILPARSRSTSASGASLRTTASWVASTSIASNPPVLRKAGP